MQDRSLNTIWGSMNGRKGDIIERSEQYARWTIPSAFMEDEHREETPSESRKSNVAIGARLVNHLSHRIVDTMFPSDRPFFALALTPEAKRKFEAEAPAGSLGLLEANLIEAENAAMRKLNLTAYRPVAVNAVVQQVITGNALIHRLPNGKRVVYSVRDFCTTRAVDGEVLEVILRDYKMFGSLDEGIQEAVQLAGGEKRYQQDTTVSLYTYYYRMGGKWHARQAVEEIEIEEARTTYNEQDFPCLPLTWNLGRGDHYGRGLVEDYAVSFHNIDVMSESMLDLIGIASDVKFLVNDTSTFDIEAWNMAERGEYVPGKEGDITVPQFKFAVETQFIADSIAKLERELSQAFLLSSSGVRDAERVTAEEIRFFAREIESAFGGLYSRLALDWQRREAEYMLSEIDFNTYFDGMEAFETVVTTGLESLSREGKLDSLRLAIADLQMLDAVPEDLRAAINPQKFAAHIFQNRNVQADFLYTQEEMQAIQQQRMQQEQQMMAEQGAMQVAQAAATQQ